MSLEVERLKNFVNYAHKCKGDEKGEAQVYCDRLFQGFGHGGYKEAGATLEARIRKSSGKGVNFADLVWRPRLIMEMKKKREKLHLHYRQAFDYWINCVPSRPRYVVLCNFDEFSIYDFDKQIDEPVDHVELDDLPRRYPAMNFMFPIEKKPLFDNDREDVSRKAADQMADLYKSLVGRARRAVPKEHAQRFVLQTVVSMFAEDIDLLPAGTVMGIVGDCKEHGQSSYDLFGGLFRQMDCITPATGGRYAGVQYFNGGLFSQIHPIELSSDELNLIGGYDGAAKCNWSKVNPSIFGTLFQDSMDKERRHALGAHFTSEADIQRIVGPTIVRPSWQARIDAAKSADHLLRLRRELMAFRVLDPACGSGNFLYVAFREMARLDIRIMSRLRDMMGKVQFNNHFRLQNAISARQFFGIDIDAFGVELAKVTLMLAKKLSADEVARTFQTGGQGELALEGDAVLPLDNLDANIVKDDALFSQWPACDVIIGNPPYQSKNKIQKSMKALELRRVRDAYPDVDGRADYCTYWFRLAHNHLAEGQRAGLVSTNTIRQNYSREASTDYIIKSGGTITEAVSSMVWPGEANLHVSVVCWMKGDDAGPKRLYLQEGNDPDKNWHHEDLPRIGPSLSFEHDVTTARVLLANSRLGGCFQGQTQGHKGFLVDTEAAHDWLGRKKYAKVLRPFMIAEDLIGNVDGKPSRYVIDFSDFDVLAARQFTLPFKQVEKMVLPARTKAANEESDRNKEITASDPKAKVNHHHANFLKKWWVLSYPREEMKNAIGKLTRYATCGNLTKRPIFEFVSSSINPNAQLQVFPYEDDYSFGVLQSSAHWIWFVNRCSTLTERYRYTSNTVFDTFPWPQTPSLTAIKDVAQAAHALREGRNVLKQKYSMSFRELYKTSEQAGDHPLKKLHAKLDSTVNAAYGFVRPKEPLAELLSLNLRLAADEASGMEIIGPGLPHIVNDRDAFVTTDMIAI